MLAAITRLHDWTAPAGLFFIIQNPPAHWSHLIYGHSFTVGLWIYCLPFCECPAFTMLSLIIFLLLSPRVCSLRGLISHLHELITQHALQISIAACTILQLSTGCLPVSLCSQPCIPKPLLRGTMQYLKLSPFPSPSPWLPLFLISVTRIIELEISKFSFKPHSKLLPLTCSLLCISKWLPGCFKILALITLAKQISFPFGT